MNEDTARMGITSASGTSAEPSLPLEQLTRRGSIQELEARVAELAAEAEDLLALATRWHQRAEALEAELLASREGVNALQRRLQETEEEIRHLTADKSAKEEAKRSWLDRLRKR